MKANIQFLYLNDFLLVWEIFLKKCCRENSDTYFMCNNSPPLENSAVYDIMWKNTVQPCKSQMTTWRMRITYWIHQATNTPSEYLLFFHGNSSHANASQCYFYKYTTFLFYRWFRNNEIICLKPELWIMKG
jgi:hypothetical protein